MTKKKGDIVIWGYAAGGVADINKLKGEAAEK